MDREIDRLKQDTSLKLAVLPIAASLFAKYHNVVKTDRSSTVIPYFLCYKTSVIRVRLPR